MSMHIISRKNTSQILKFFLFCTFSLAAVAHAETYRASSSKHPVALIELYTSQGCSSCPPAEQWLGNLEDSGISNKQAVPLALHVDYWDYIGWQDQFAQKYFTRRQSQYQKMNHSSSVYTPQIMFNGKDVRRVRLNDSLGQLGNKKAVVAFDVEVQDIRDSVLRVNIDFSRIDEVAKNSRLILVLAENNMIGNIKSGENSGKKLHHNHVARVWKNLGDLKNKISTELAIKKDWQRSNLELIVIVETPDMQTQQALQLALK